jgi:hypothetical protein
MLVSLSTVLVSGFGVGLCLFVFARVVEMRGLVMMVGRSVMMGGRLMVMLAGRMLGFCHGAVPPERIEKTRFRLQLGWGQFLWGGNSARGSHCPPRS